MGAWALGAVSDDDEVAWTPPTAQESWELYQVHLSLLALNAEISLRALDANPDGPITKALWGRLNTLRDRTAKIEEQETADADDH